MTEKAAVVEIVRNKVATKFELDNRLSINTVIACITILAAVVAVSDRIASNAATTAVIQNKQSATDLAFANFLVQRNVDRQEILVELRFIKEELRDATLASRSK